MQGVRVLAIIILCSLLGSLLLLAGATGDEPMTHEYPNDVDVRQDRGSYVGEQVVLGGQVVETDPVVISTMASGHGNFTLADVDEHLENHDGPVEQGDQLTVFGTLEEEETLAVEQAIRGDSSGTRYMFAVSAVAILWVTARVARDWRFDPSTLAFVPRDQSTDRRDVSGGDSGRRLYSRTRQANRPATADEPPRRRTDRRGEFDADGGERRG